MPRYDLMRVHNESVGGKLVTVLRVSCDGEHVADFNTGNGGKGHEAFRMFLNGVRQADRSLYDADRRVYMTGTLDELLGAA